MVNGNEPSGQARMGYSQRAYKFGDTVNGWILGADNKWYRDENEHVRTQKTLHTISKFVIKPSAIVLTIALLAVAGLFLFRQYLWNQNSAFAHQVHNIVADTLARCGSFTSDGTSSNNETSLIARNNQTIRISGVTCGGGDYLIKDAKAQPGIQVSGTFISEGPTQWCVQVSGIADENTRSTNMFARRWDSFTADHRVWVFTNLGETDYPASCGSGGEAVPRAEE